MTCFAIHLTILTWRTNENNKMYCSVMTGCHCYTLRNTAYRSESTECPASVNTVLAVFYFDHSRKAKDSWLMQQYLHFSGAASAVSLFSLVHPQGRRHCELQMMPTFVTYEHQFD